MTRSDQIGPVTEMAIVNAFTKLIFVDEHYSEEEVVIVDALRAVSADALRESYEQIGEYLRRLGVREMIQLVALVKEHIDLHGSALGSSLNQPQSDAGLRSAGLCSAASSRRIH
ncbi:MAG: hypothetical protein HRT77_08960 [Halioglobus sp.]|nr:hypothetical protein [Halioglobus sp.]